MPRQVMPDPASVGLLRCQGCRLQMLRGAGCAQKLHAGCTQAAHRLHTGCTQAAQEHACRLFQLQLGCWCKAAWTATPAASHGSAFVAARCPAVPCMETCNTCLWYHLCPQGAAFSLNLDKGSLDGSSEGSKPAPTDDFTKTPQAVALELICRWAAAPLVHGTHCRLQAGCWGQPWPEQHLWQPQQQWCSHSTSGSHSSNGAATAAMVQPQQQWCSHSTSGSHSSNGAATAAMVQPQHLWQPQQQWCSLPRCTKPQQCAAAGVWERGRGEAGVKPPCPGTRTPKQHAMLACVTGCVLVGTHECCGPPAGATRSRMSLWSCRCCEAC